MPKRLAYLPLLTYPEPAPDEGDPGRRQVCGRAGPRPSCERLRGGAATRLHPAARRHPGHDPRRGNPKSSRVRPAGTSAVDGSDVVGRAGPEPAQDGRPGACGRRGRRGGPLLRRDAPAVVEGRSRRSGARQDDRVRVGQTGDPGPRRGGARGRAACRRRLGRKPHGGARARGRAGVHEPGHPGHGGDGAWREGPVGGWRGAPAGGARSRSAA